MNKKANVPTWIFGILLIYIFILIFSLYFGKVIITNSAELTSMYGQQPSVWDSTSLLLKISTFQVTDIIPVWITLLLNFMSVVVVLGIIMIVRGVS